MSFGDHRENLIDTCYQWQKCSAETLLSDGLSFLWIFTAVTWGGGLKQ